MNYTKVQLDAMPDAEGSTASAKLKVDTADVRVWLVNRKRFGAIRYEVIVETKQGGAWRQTKRYPV